MRRRTRGVPLLAALVVSVLVGCRDDQPTTPSAARLAATSPGAAGSSADVPVGTFAAPTYIRDEVAPQLTLNEGIVRVYQDEQPWFGSNRAHATLLSLGQVPGMDYFIHPLADLQDGIPPRTTLVIITSNSEGEAEQAARQNHPAAQAALAGFLRRGGRLIVDMGDNLADGGFIAPGATGTPHYFAPDPCWDATLTPEGEWHPFRTAHNVLDNDNIDIDGSIGCYVAHGNLEQGLTLPPDATPLMTAVFGGVPRIILAEYCFEGVGLVILDTNTKEYEGQRPRGTDPALVMENLFAYALDGRTVHHPACEEPLPPPCTAVDVQIVAGNRLPPGTVDLSIPWLGVAILGSEVYNIPRRPPLRSEDIRLGPWDTRETEPTPAERYLVGDLDGDGRRDLLAIFDMERLVQDGNLSPATTELTLWARDPFSLLYCGTTEVAVVP